MDAVEEKEIIFKENSCKKIYQDTVVNIFSKFTNETLPQKANIIKDNFDKIHGKSWCVFVGKHMTGCCSCIEKTLLEFTEDNTKYVLFKSYIPQ